MKELLKEVGEKISSFRSADNIDMQVVKYFARQTVVALSAGGEGSRFKNVVGIQAVHKASFLLPNGETMIERTIRMYAEVGFSEFVALTYHNAESIEQLLGDGTSYGVRVTYSRDPAQPVGRGGAIKNALENGAIPKEKHLIVHNPDDQFVGDTKTLLSSVVTKHVRNTADGALATAVVVPATPYGFTGMKVEKDIVTDISMYPDIPIPAHVGMTVFSSDVYPYFMDLFDLRKKTDFESVLFPLLEEKRQLYACAIPVDSWIAVNDEKGYKKLLERLAI